MKQIIWLDMQASSINSAYYSDKRLGYNAKTKDWIAEVCRQLSLGKNQKSIDSLKSFFNPEKHCFHVSVEYGSKKFFNKAGTISSQDYDVGNITKTLLDIVYTPAFNGSGTHKCQNLNIDDKYITALYTKKVPSAEFYQKIIIHIRPLPSPCA